MTGTTASGSIGLGSDAGGANQYRGVFMWRTAGLDYTPPVITPSVVGTLGNNGWYRSAVSVSFTVTDPESAIVSTAGCDPSTITSDTAGDDVHVHRVVGGLRWAGQCEHHRQA